MDISQMVVRELWHIFLVAQFMYFSFGLVMTFIFGFFVLVGNTMTRLLGASSKKKIIKNVSTWQGICIFLIGGLGLLVCIYGTLGLRQVLIQAALLFLCNIFFPREKVFCIEEQ